MSTRPTSHSSTTSTLTSTTTSTTTTTPDTTTTTGTAATLASGLTDSLSAAMQQPESGPARELASLLTQPVTPGTPGTVQTTATESTARETKAPALPAPATLAQALNLIHRDVTVTDSLIPAVLTRVSAAATPEGTGRMATVRIEGSSAALQTLQGGPAFDVHGGYSSYRVRLDDLRLRPAPPSGPLQLLLPDEVAALPQGAHVLVAGAAVVVMGHEVNDETDELLLVVASPRFEPRLHDLDDNEDKEEAVKGGKTPPDGIWTYHIAIDEADVRAMVILPDSKQTRAPGKSPLDG